MATTSSTVAAGTAVVGQGGNGRNGRSGLKAKLAAGAAILGCAAALTFGGLRQGDGAPPQPATAASFSQRNGVAQQQFLAWNLELPGGTISAEQQRFFDLNTQLPDGTLPIARVSVETMRFLELNTQLPDGGTATPRLDWETIRLIEQNQLPELTMPTSDITLPGPANFQGEDH